MAISEKRYAAEFVDREGTVLKFDDIGCMLGFVGEQRGKEKGAAYFVTDYAGQGWIEAERAHYVKSEEIRSPMASGLAAFRDKAKAQETAGKFHGRMLTFGELWKQ